MRRKPSVLIAGGGTGGLTAALAALKRSCDVEERFRNPALADR